MQFDPIIGRFPIIFTVLFCLFTLPKFHTPSFIGESKREGISPLFMCLFICLCVLNLTALWAYIFTPTAHISFTFSLAVGVFIAVLTASFSSFLFEFVLELVPKATPGYLVNFIVLIELVSKIVRPVTLGVRLAANLTAGHVLLGIITLHFPLLILEILVGVVQAYVFTLLFKLYFEE